MPSGKNAFYVTRDIANKANLIKEIAQKEKSTRSQFQRSCRSDRAEEVSQAYLLIGIFVFVFLFICRHFRFMPILMTMNTFDAVLEY